MIHLWTNGDNTTTLAESVFTSECCVGVTHLSGKLQLPDSWSMKPLYLCCDFIHPVYVRNIKLPVLSQITTNSKGFVTTSIHHVTWLKCKRDELKRPRLYICNEKGDILTFEGRGIYCTLQICQSDGFSEFFGIIV